MVDAMEVSRAKIVISALNALEKSSTNSVPARPTRVETVPIILPLAIIGAAEESPIGMAAVEE
jgi:hypothetical protein